MMKDFRPSQKWFSPFGILLITILGIIIAEVVAMVVVYYFRDWSYVLQVLTDAAIITIIIFPLLYLLLFRPLILQRQQQIQSESISQLRLRLVQFANTHSLDELLQFTLDEIETLVGASISFFHFVEGDQKTVWLQTWSTNTQQNMCKAEGKDSHYDLEQAGVWADAVRQRQPIVHNDYAALTNRKGMPEGHALVVRELVIPILRDEKVMAILGLGNKPQDFSNDDVNFVATIADFTWDIIEHKRSEVALSQSEGKFRTLVDWTYDWEKWLDPQGNIIYTSPSCERITGYKPEEFIADPTLLNRIVHPEDRKFYEEHKKIIHEALAGPIRVEYRIISRDGNIRWIEHICRPLFGPDEQHLGRRISNRDITDRKQNELMIIAQSKKEVILTKTIQTIQNDIARDLHDTLGQNISFLNMNLENLSRIHWDDLTVIQSRIQNLTKAASEAYGQVRDMLAILQSGYTVDPLILLTRYADQVSLRSSFQIEISNLGVPKPLSQQQIRQIFYIFRESLSNIEKHANANHVTCELIWGDDSLNLDISDNGQGFDPDSIDPTGHYGLKFMNERAERLKGSLDLKTIPGQGTTIRVVVPYEKESYT